MDAHAVYAHQSRSTSSRTSKPSSITVASLPRISNSELSKHVLAGNPSLAIIDVRDSDYIGGHIKGCTNIPSSNLDWKLPELVRDLREKEVVVFHCMLSQQRGPGAALRYLRERQRLFPGDEPKADKKDDATKDEEQGRKEEQTQQQVYILEGGFEKWQEKFGGDARLTEGYVKDLWDY